MKQINWTEIAFKQHSPKDCEERFNFHLRRVRRHRNLNEIVVDIETNIKESSPETRLSAYQLFVQEQLSSATSSEDFVSFLYMQCYIACFNSVALKCQLLSVHLEKLAAALQRITAREENGVRT